MRKMKKLIAVVVTLALVVGMVSLAASAESTPVVKLLGRTQAQTGDTYELDLVVTGAEVGGIQGTISYDTAVLDYDGVKFGTEFVEANEKIPEEKIIQVDETNGTIAFIGLNSGLDVVWFTLTFKTVGEAADTPFVLDDSVLKFKAAKVDGSGAAEGLAAELPTVVQVVKADQVNMLGATIKATAEVGEQDIKFQSAIDCDETLVIEEYGVIFLPKQLLNGQELVADTDYNYGTESKPVKAAIAKIDGSDPNFAKFGNKTALNATLKGSSSYHDGKFRQTDFVARAYVKLTDGSIVYLYSNNDGEEVEDNIDNGYAVRSIIGIAKKIASRIVTDAEVVFTESVKNADDVATLTKDRVLESSEEIALLDFIVTNKALVAKYAE